MEQGFSGMGIDEIKLFGGLLFQMINAIATAGVWLYVRYGNRNDIIDARLSALRSDMDSRLDKHESDLSGIKGGLQNSPKHSDLMRIHTRIDEDAGAMRRIEGEFSSTGKTVDLIHSYLLNEGKRQ